MESKPAAVTDDLSVVSVLQERFLHFSAIITMHTYGFLHTFTNLIAHAHAVKLFCYSNSLIYFMFFLIDNTSQHGGMSRRCWSVSTLSRVVNKVVKS